VKRIDKERGGTRPERRRGALGGGRVAAIFALLYAATFPWYLPRDWIEPTFWAFPAWGVVTVLGSIAIGAFTACIYLFAWPEAPQPDLDAKS
jgi:hypothetical protein